MKNGRTIKPRAGLQLDTYEMVIKGNLDGTIVTAGDPTVSTLYQVVVLPDDDSIRFVDVLFDLVLVRAEVERHRSLLEHISHLERAEFLK